jgi:hypothetical protein
MLMFKLLLNDNFMFQKGAVCNLITIGGVYCTTYILLINLFHVSFYYVISYSLGTNAQCMAWLLCWVMFKY